MSEIAIAAVVGFFLACGIAFLWILWALSREHDPDEHESFLNDLYNPEDYH